jgi:predicted Ser/Thr protein kinase
MNGEAPPADGSGGAPSERTALKGSDSSSPGRAKTRFTPGSMLGDRYRVVALLGKGGMGEVYRAEDTRLGQQVALKFLPRQFASDPVKLERLFAEVRIGRQVSHPNVCRLYDVAEIDGHHFIAMEYIDGEDLSSLLRRIGKLPHEKALDLARDICAGLAAAHGLGIVHRDLKPANVMIDGRGDARITDFGLAVLAEDLEERREIAGTPGYMAPEQLSGGVVSQKTDLYALGLILYEMFTGKRLFEGATFGEIVSRHATTGSQSISRETASLDPAVQRVIVRCLESDPAKRPGSIHAVIAALPGGDPLQAAIDAGETPSPEMIAAAGSSGELRPAIAWPLLIVTLLILGSAAALSPRVRLYGQIDLPLEGVELAVRARQIVAAGGVPARPADTAWEFGVDPQYRLWKREQNRLPESGREHTDELFSPLLFGYRESPLAMRSGPARRVYAFGNIPPLSVGGMGRVVLEPDGRLRRVVIVPPEMTQPGAGAIAPDWGPLFEAAGLDIGAARETPPLWRPPTGSDRRYAWLAAAPGFHDPVRVEAASLAGTAVWLEVFPPWRRPYGPGRLARPVDRLFGVLNLLTLFIVVGVGAILANRNLRRGRGDRQGAWRLGALVALLTIVWVTLRSDFSSDDALPTFISNLSDAAFAGVLIWIMYLALEPYLRRRWPRTLISWSRLLQNRWLDARVGRDIMIGVLAGASFRLVHFATLAAPALLGWNTPIPWDRSFLDLSGWRFTLSYLFDNLAFCLMLALAWMVILLGAHVLLRRRELAVAAVFVAAAGFFPLENYPVLEWTARLALGTTVTIVMVRYGLVALSVALLTILTFGNFPVTLDPTVWYFGRSLVALVLLFGLAIFGFVRSLGAQALVGEPLLED